MGSSRRYITPRTFITKEGSYPEGPFQTETPIYATRTAAFVRNLNNALSNDSRSVRQICLAAGINPGTVSRLLSGQAVPDLGTIAILEDELGRDLWAARPIVK